MIAGENCLGMSGRFFMCWVMFASALGLRLLLVQRCHAVTSPICRELHAFRPDNGVDCKLGADLFWHAQAPLPKQRRRSAVTTIASAPCGANHGSQKVRAEHCADRHHAFAPLPSTRAACEHRAVLWLLKSC